MGFAGQVELHTGEYENDFDNYGVNILVKYRDTEPLQKLTAHHQVRRNVVMLGQPPNEVGSGSFVFRFVVIAVKTVFTSISEDLLDNNFSCFPSFFFLSSL
jgi:hypothetical protein